MQDQKIFQDQSFIKIPKIVIDPKPVICYTKTENDTLPMLNEKPFFKCTHVDQNLCNRSVKYHMLETGENPFMCLFCGQGFNLKVK